MQCMDNIICAASSVLAADQFALNMKWARAIWVLLAVRYSFPAIPSQDQYSCHLTHACVLRVASRAYHYDCLLVHRL